MILEGYGRAETSPLASFNRLDDRRVGSIGLPVSGVELRVVDAGGAEVADGETGEIVVRGHNVMKGYWNRPDETARTVVDGWLHTGDVGDQGRGRLLPRRRPHPPGDRRMTPRPTASRRGSTSRPAAARADAPLLRVEDLAVTYGGAVQALRGVEPHGRGGRRRGPARQQRRRQDHPAADPVRAPCGCTAAGSSAVRCSTAARTSRAATPPAASRAAWCRCRRGGASSPGSPSRRTSAPAVSASATAADRPDYQHIYDMFPVLAERRTQRAGLLLRRRAADARDRARADVAARSCCCWTSRRSGSPRGSSARSAR